MSDLIQHWPSSYFKQQVGLDDLSTNIFMILHFCDCEGNLHTRRHLLAQPWNGTVISVLVNDQNQPQENACN